MQRQLAPGFALLVLLAACGGEPTEPATLVVTGSKVWTGDPEQPWAEAVAVRGEEIAAVGSAADVARLIGPETRLIEAPGGLLAPGFIDTHVHFTEGGAGLASVQLRDAATPEAFVQRIGEFAAGMPPGEWLLNGNWDHTLWGGELPARDWIDAVTPDNPVWITRLDGHMGLANSAALELAGVDADTPDVDGGEIVRDGEGRPTGILKDNAMALVASAVPAPGEALRDRQVRAAMAYVASNGVTTVHDMGSFADMAAYRRLHADDALITRIYSVVPLAEWQTLVQEVAANGTGDEWLRIGGLKGFMDGSLGSHTAAFFEPFTDTPDDRGLYVSDPADVREWVAAADGAGLHVMIHAIGDRAIDELLDIYAELGAGAGAERPAERGAEPAATSTAAPGAERASGGDAGASRERRLRMEHAQHIRPADIPRFTELGVIASMQPYHAIDDGRWAEAVIGPERIQTTYAFRSLLDAGARLAFGSDWPVAPATPLEGIYAAVTRRTLDGANPDGWVPEQEITVEEALLAYTADAAYASFDEDRKGMLRPGWLADMVLVDRDLTAVPPETLGDARVLATIVGGEVVFEAGGEP